MKLWGQRGCVLHFVTFLEHYKDWGTCFSPPWPTPYQTFFTFMLGVIMVDEKYLVVFFISIQTQLYWTSLCLRGFAEIFCFSLLLIFLPVTGLFSYWFTRDLSILRQFIVSLYHYSQILLPFCYLPSDLVYWVPLTSPVPLSLHPRWQFRSFFLVVNKCVDLSLCVWILLSYLIRLSPLKSVIQNLLTVYFDYF